MIIRALVRARLFGMRILTLEARVVVGTDDGLPAVTDTYPLPAWPEHLESPIIAARPGVRRNGAGACARDRAARTGHGHARAQPPPPLRPTRHAPGL